MAVALNPVYVDMINAFKVDCETIMVKFKEKHSDDFRDFVSVWKELRFNLIYEKYTSQGLHHDFKEDTLQIAKQIMFNNSFVGGMYLIYGLYYVQDDPKGSVRLELKEFEKLTELLKQERDNLITTCQPAYLFAKLLKNDAFTFVTFARDFSMEGQNRARILYGNQPVRLDHNKTIQPAEWIQNCLHPTGLLDQLREVDEKYFKIKKKLKEGHPELNLALDMVPDNVIEGLQATLSETEHKIPQQKKESIGEKRRRLKARRMEIRHRYASQKRERRRRRKKGNTDGAECKPTVKKETVKKETVIKKEPVTKLESPTKRRKGPRKGKRKLYFKEMINEPHTESEDSCSSVPSKVLDLPIISEEKDL